MDGSRGEIFGVAGSLEHRPREVFPDKRLPRLDLFPLATVAFENFQSLLPRHFSPHPVAPFIFLLCNALLLTFELFLSLPGLFGLALVEFGI